MSSLLKKAPIFFGKGKMIKVGNLNSLVRGRKVCRKTYSQTNDGDAVVELCLVNFVVELQFCHQI